MPSVRLELAYAQRKSTGGQTVIRRLNRLELRSTCAICCTFRAPPIVLAQ